MKKNIESIFTLHSHYRKKLKTEHWDLRILSPNKKYVLSFAIPKKKFPSKNNEKILFIRTVDHPLSVLILKGNLSNGDKLKILDTGLCDYINVSSVKIDIVFSGKKINGHYIFINTHEDSWLVIRKK